MSTFTSKYERVATLAEVGDDDSIDPTITPSRRGQDRHRPCDEDGQPAVPMEATLLREVERTAYAHEQALEDLRRWRLSHDHAEAPRCPVSRELSDPCQYRPRG